MYCSVSRRIGLTAKGRQQPKDEGDIVFTKLVRIGRDAELKTTGGGKMLLSVSVVYDVGWGENKKAQWLSLSMWGAQAEKVHQHFNKGKQIVIRADDIHVEEHNGKSYLKATLVSFEFVSEAKRDAPPQSAHNQQKSNGYQNQPVNDPFDEIPF